jgi:micrococcal nuclease
MEVFLFLSGAAVFVLVLIFRDKSGHSDTTSHRTPLRPITPQTRTAPKPSRPASFGSITGKCYVIDGDTIIIQRTKIRLAGIDAPELDQPLGQKSKWAMVQICKGKVITAKLTGETSHDRQVATCYCPEGRDIGGELVKQGLALDWALFSGGKYRHLEPQGIRRKMMYVRRCTLQETPLARNDNTRRNPG